MLQSPDPSTPSTSIEWQGSLFKVLDKNGYPLHGGVGRWYLPQDGEPGDWMPHVSNLIPCKRGYHLCRPTDLPYWLGPTIYEAEACPGYRLIYDDIKVVTSKARLLRKLESWNERTMRLFAADCVEHVLPNLGVRYPSDLPREAIRLARLYANGGASKPELADHSRKLWRFYRDGCSFAIYNVFTAAAWSLDPDAAKSASWAPRDCLAAEPQNSAGCSWQANRLMEVLYDNPY